MTTPRCRHFVASYCDNCNQCFSCCQCESKRHDPQPERQAQRESWLRGEMAMAKDRRTGRVEPGDAMKCVGGEMSAKSTGTTTVTLTAAPALSAEEFRETYEGDPLQIGNAMDREAVWKFSEAYAQRVTSDKDRQIAELKKQLEDYQVFGSPQDLEKLLDNQYAKMGLSQLGDCVEAVRETIPELKAGLADKDREIERLKEQVAQLGHDALFAALQQKEKKQC